MKAQGEMIDNVETNLAQTLEYVEKAEVHMEKAQDIHEGNKKKMCCIIWCMSIGAIIMLILLSGVIPF